MPTIAQTYRNLLNEVEASESWADHVVKIQPVIGVRTQWYMNSRRRMINGIVQQLCKEEDYNSWMCGSVLCRARWPAP